MEFAVDGAMTVTDAERLLQAATYDLVIIDVMIPVTAAEENSAYAPSRTDSTHKTGLVFYQKHAELLQQAGTRVAVLTVRIDDAIRREFMAAGLPAGAFRTKLELRHAPRFVEFVTMTLAGMTS
jgi:DNA-binding NarL/FixJ family response regulator